VVLGGPTTHRCSARWPSRRSASWWTRSLASSCPCAWC